MRALPHGIGQLAQNVHCLRPADAGVGHALSIHQRLALDRLLRAGDEVALNHDADNTAIARVICPAMSRATTACFV